MNRAVEIFTRKMQRKFKKSNDADNLQ